VKKIGGGLGSWFGMKMTLMSRWGGEETIGDVWFEMI
jgi:hypothetical protein